MKSQNKLFLALSLVLVLTMLLSACQAQPQTIVQTVVVTQEVMVQGTPQVKEVVITATPEPTQAPTPVPPTAAPQAADSVVIGLQQEPDSLHPIISSMVAQRVVQGPWLVTCMGQDEKANWINLGCEGDVPTIDNGGSKWVGEGDDKHLEVTHKIRKDWRWNDGTPVTSADAIYNWKLWMDPNMEAADRTAYEKIYDIVAVDDKTYTVQFMSLNQAKAAAKGELTGNVDFKTFQPDYETGGYGSLTGPVVDPVYFTFGTAWLPEHVMGKTPAADQKTLDFTTVPGDGPYNIKEWKQGQEIILEKSDQPFPLGDNKIKTITIRFFADTAAMLAALQNGEIDAVGQIGLTTNNAPDLDKIEAEGAYKAYYTPGYAWEHIDVNTTKFPLDDIKVREALYYAIDKKAIVDKLYYGKQLTTDLPGVLEGTWPFPAEYNKYPYDPDKAKALLAEAGWNCEKLPCTKEINGEAKKLEFTLMTTDRADRQALAQVIQQMWKKVNVGVNLQFLYGRGLFAPGSQGGPLYSRTFDTAIYTWVTGDDPAYRGLYDCASIPTKENGYEGQNNPGWCNKDADKLLEANEVNPETSLSREARKPILQDWYKLWTADIPVIPLFSNTTVTVARTGFENWKPGMTSSAYETWNAWEWVLNK